VCGSPHERRSNAQRSIQHSRFIRVEGMGMTLGFLDRVGEPMIGGINIAEREQGGTSIKAVAGALVG
jgi:hypothetical protein